MKRHICNIVKKDLSRANHFGGINFVDYYENIFDTNYNTNFNISKIDLRIILLNDEYIKFDSSQKNISLKVEYFETKWHRANEEELYNYNYIKNLFKEENNTIVLLIYKLIIDFKRTTYNEIANTISKINSNLKIDKKQTSHYCKLLKKINLLFKGKKLSKNNERVVFKNDTLNLYNKVVIDQSNSEDEGSDTEQMNQNVKDQINFEFSTTDHYKNSLHPEKILEISKAEGLYLTNSMKLSKHFLENRLSFIVDENNIENNLYFHLLINKEKGLTINQICSLLGFLGRDKAIVRFLNNLDKKNYIQHFSIRKGKKFEYVYKINEGAAPVGGFIYNYVDYYLNKETNDESNIDNNKIIPVVMYKTLDSNFVKNESERMNNTNNISLQINQNISDFKIEKLIQSSNQMIFDDDFDISNIKTLKMETTDNNISMPLNKSQILKFNFDNNIISLNYTDFFFISNQIFSDKKYETIKLKYQEFTSTQSNFHLLSKQTKLNIILDFFYANSKYLKLRTFDNVNLNRFLFCLNKIQERKILTMNDIKLFIINELENKIGFKIDRKTLRNVLLNLETLGFIKTMEFELVMKNKNYMYNNNKDEIVQRKLIVMRRDVNLTPEMISDIEELIKPRQKQIKSTDLELVELDIEDDFKENSIDVDDINLDLNDLPHFHENNYSNINFDANKIKEIKQEINHLVANIDLKIDYSEKIVLKFVDILERIQEKNQKNNGLSFMTRWKRLYFVKQNLIHIFKEFSENKIKIENEEIKKIPLYKVFASNSSQRIIVPDFMIQNTLEDRDYPFVFHNTIIPDNKLSINNPYSKSIPDMATLIASKAEEKRKYETPYDTTFLGLIDVNKAFTTNITLNEDEIKFARTHFKIKKYFEDDTELIQFLETKRKREKSGLIDINKCDKIRKISEKKEIHISNKNKKFNANHYTKIIDFYPILSKIYFNPNITMKKLRNSLVSLLPSETIYTDFLLYLYKIGLLKIGQGHLIDYSKKVIRIDDDMSLELDDTATKFLII